MKNVLAHPATRIAALVLAAIILVAAVLVLVTRGVGDDRGATPPVFDFPEDATPEDRARAHLDTLPDGDHQGRLITIDADTVTFRLVRVLRGPEAVEAARADGVLLEGADLPGGTYVQYLMDTRTLPLGDEPRIEIAGGPTTVDALVSGEAAPPGDIPVFVFTMADGAVVSFTQVDVP